MTLRNVGLHGPFVRVDINKVGNIRWLGGELGTAGRTGGKRVVCRDALPVQVGEADHITFDEITFHPQDADETPSNTPTCISSNGFHLEMIRLDGGTSFFTLRNSTFENGDHSGTASIFITEPGGDAEPHDLTFENNFFGTSDSSVALDVHANVSRCLNFTFAYNTFLKTPGLFQCTSDVNVKWIGNLGPNGPSSPCFGTSINNVWQDPRRDSCGSDKWVYRHPRADRQARSRRCRRLPGSGRLAGDQRGRRQRLLHHDAPGARPRRPGAPEGHSLRRRRRRVRRAGTRTGERHACHNRLEPNAFGCPTPDADVPRRRIRRR